MVHRRKVEVAVVFVLAVVLSIAFFLLKFPAPSPTGYVTLERSALPLLDPTETGFNSENRSDNYEELIGSLYANGNVTTTIGSNLWVPWFSTSSSCLESNLHSGGNCNSGETIDFQNNCMVTDEFSQVGILVAMGQNQTRMDQFFNTVNAINSSYGRIPAWRVYRDNSLIEQCRTNINGNCDTASDATARIIIALFSASNNSFFSDSSQKDLYWQLAVNFSSAMVEHEIVQTCHPSSLGQGDICYWLAAGANAASGGLASGDFGYTGYYADAIIAMLHACTQTKNMTYCAVAGNLTLNYLEASKWDGSTFTVPPGRSYRWGNLSGIPNPECTNTCSPVQWDGADAPRALGMCQANYYAGSLLNYTLPLLNTYCNVWGDLYMNNTNSAPLQYYPDGTLSSGYQSGYFAQGLQGLFHSGGNNPTLFEATVDNALGHYSSSSGTWDSTACFGVYQQAFAVRALGIGIGRDMDSFPLLEAVNSSESNTTQNISFSSTAPSASVNIVEPANQTFNYTLNNPDNIPATSTWYLNGTNQTSSFNTTSFAFIGNYTSHGDYNITVKIISTQNNLTYSWNLTVTNFSVNATQNISFASISPTSNTTIAEPNSQDFSFTLTNPDSIATLSTWYLNGTNQTSAFNSSSITFVGSYSSAGDWNITLEVWSSQNTLEHQFNLTVTDTPEPPGTPPPSSSGGGGGGGGGALLTSSESQENIAQVVEEEPRSITIQDIVSDFFSGSTSTEELVDALRAHFGGASLE